MHRYFGLAKTIRYAVTLPIAIYRDANIEAFKRFGLCESQVGGVRIRWRVPMPNFIEEVIEKRCYFPPDRQFHLNPNDLIIDAGANVGTFTLYAASIAKSGMVVALEPNTIAFRCLQENVIENKATNVILINGLLGQAEGTVDFNEVDSGGSYVSGFTKKKHIKVKPSFTVESLLRMVQASRINFLKVSIEGAEFDVFSDPSFLRKVDKVAMEVHHRFGDVRRLREAIASEGFDVTMQKSYVSASYSYLYASRP